MTTDAPAPHREMSAGGYELLRSVADSVMREGQVLYPYRASSAKNQYRWIFGVVVPPSFGSETGEPASLSGHVRVDAAEDGAVAHVVVRFLHPHSRIVVDADRSPVAQLDVDGDLLVSFDDAQVVELDLVASVAGHPVEARHQRPRTVDERELRDRAGRLHGYVISTDEAIDVGATVQATRSEVGVAVTNHTVGSFDDRVAATRASACGVHALVELRDGRLAGGTDLQRGGLWPSLAGHPGRARHALLTPMVLPDHPQLAPETTGELFDGLEIEEILNLRLQTLTPTEQREAAATDPWAAAALQRAGALDAADLARLHGTQRHATRHLRGSTVVLRPTGRTDSIDLAVDGRRATVRDIRTDHDGRVFVGVTVDDDPATPLHLARGRLFWFQEDELDDE